MENAIFENDLPDISIVGSGIKFPEHLTLETIAILEHCQSVYTIATHLNDEKNTPLGLHKKIKNLWHLYKPDRLRRENYKAMAQVIFDAAHQERPIAYLASGNPVVFDSVTQWIIQGAEKQGLTVKIFPAISSIDTIMVDLKYEVAPGLQIYDASMLVGFNLEPRVNVPCILLQISTFGTSYTTAYRIPKKDVLSPLKTYLLRFYPSNHQLFLISCPLSSENTSEIMPICLEELDSTNPEHIRGSSLFIPKLHKPKENLEFLTKMQDQNYFSNNYSI
ncbi:SAM-dependent methyltransferase [Planktothrix pseudagardhii]|uniref:Tetrapyrrole methylase domain-containing protein n=1 Tax=Planktothrix pseudagardhii TaxID=132604 RepID=A0A9W4G2W6_9CYAN|nr:SAM-dependent methyltransferase [Planktothrix pseudagardhii]CAD5928840.1 hypothetical protein NO713_01153 [Planktothrix pseudagardhii]